MTPWQYTLASLRQFRRVHLAVAAGVAIASAVITGALLVGDSVRGSLRDLALEGLGRIDSVLIAEHPFREKLADEWLAAPTAKRTFTDAVPLLLTQGAAVFRTPDGEVRRAARLQVIGASPGFWWLDRRIGEPPFQLHKGIALSEPVAQELGVKVGDAVLLRLPITTSVPADSALGAKGETTASRRLEVTGILADDQFPARFALRPSQQAPRNAFVPLKTLQEVLNLERKANAIALARAASAARALAAPHPELADLGVNVERIDLGGDHAYARISADRLVLAPHVVTEAENLFGKKNLQPAVTYLANTIVAGERKIPYSTVAGVDSSAELGPVLDNAGKPVALADDEVALNDWAARDLRVEVSDEVTLSWYDPETTHGQLRESPPLTLKVRAIVPLGEANPTAAADPQFAPALPGVTDQESIDDWDLPFELVEKIRKQDEDYWDKYRTTPKAFISHALAARLWKSRWGVESVLRLPLTVDNGLSEKFVAEQLREHLDPAALGMNLLPVKRQAIASAAGTTPFDGLFLGFSFFLLAAALMLVALLYRLGIEQRAHEVGLLLALGTAPSRVSRLLTVEAGVIAACGATVGALAGVGYARLMIFGLNTWWVDAVATPFLRLHVTLRSMAIGLAAGLMVALVTMAWSLRRFCRLPPQSLLAGQVQGASATKPASVWSRTILPAASIVTAIGLAIAALKWEGEARSLAFMGGGALVLVGVLAAVRAKLREPLSRRASSLTLAGLAARNARRNPSRTMLSLALAATASFLIVALSAFRLAPTERGAGGFDLIANADLPIHFDLNDEAGRRELGFAGAESARLAGTEFIAFRVRDGEDASCLNLYQTSQPRVLGAPPALAAASRFAWAATSAGLGESENAWTMLDADLGDDRHGQPIVPLVLDRNTAYYSLKLYKIGEQLVIGDSVGRQVTLQIVGLLANSVLQGDAIISEANFVRLFPEESGHKLFLIRRSSEAPPTEQLSSLLETQLEDFGFDAIDAERRLGELMAVQNTYLSTFQSLGALGLLLGVVGLAVVQLRSVLERRGELALMQATGFRRRRLAAMVLAENLVLLVAGLGIGCFAALVVVLPHAMAEQAGAPWGTLAILLAGVAATGVVAAWAASRSVLKAPLLPALRGD